MPTPVNNKIANVTVDSTGAGNVGTQSYSLASLAKQAGFRGAAVYEAAAIALAESSGKPTAVDHDSDGSTDYGLWQINSVHGYNSQELLTNPLYNAQCAFAIYQAAGNSFSPWTTYKSGAYLKFDAKAETANNYSVTLTPVGHDAPAVTVWKWMGKTFAGSSGATATNTVQSDPTPDINFPSLKSWEPGWLATIGNALTKPQFWMKVGLVSAATALFFIGVIVWVGSNKTISGLAGKVALA